MKRLLLDIYLNMIKKTFGNKKTGFQDDLSEQAYESCASWHFSSLESILAQRRASPTIYAIGGDMQLHQCLRYLSHATGYRVRIFECILDFLAVYKDGPGCLILDADQNGMDGLELVRQLADLKIDLPVIISIGIHNDFITSTHNGVMGFISKRCKLEKILSIVCAAIENNACERQKKFQSSRCLQYTSPSIIPKR
jgi:FixJ family two-component response regulator